LVHLKGMTGLEDLFLNGTRVSESGLSTLRKALPRTAIFPHLEP